MLLYFSPPPGGDKGELALARARSSRSLALARGVPSKKGCKPFGPGYIKRFPRGNLHFCAFVCIFAFAPSPISDVDGLHSKMLFGAIRLSILQNANVIATVCSERIRSMPLISRGALFKGANAKNE